MLYVLHKGERWKVINQPVRTSLMLELQESCPGKRIMIQHSCDPRKVEQVFLGKVILDL